MSDLYSIGRESAGLDDLHPAPVDLAFWQAASAYLAPPLIEGLSRRTAAESSWIEPVEGTLLMADISGFTRMSERLAELGKEGAEWLTNTINVYFQSMLDTAAAEGGGNLKFGGDALLILFTGDGHAERGERAAMRMQTANRRQASVRLERERIRLKMSIGVHSGRFGHACGTAGSAHAALILGPDASEVARAEVIAGTGEVVITEATYGMLAGCRVQEKRDSSGSYQCGERAHRPASSRRPP
jgi:class 3 adenylate cyclase